MISVLIETHNSDELLARTLTGLVGGAVEGLLSDVIVVDHGSQDQTHRVADAAGCIFLQDQMLIDGFMRGRSDWFLLLEPGARLMDGWIEPVAVHVERMQGPACFTRASLYRKPLLKRLFSAANPIADGLLISRRQSLTLLKPDTRAADLARGLAMKRMRAEIVPAPAR
ncbi:glycosyl transferase family 2 [Phyllobacterium sp. 0TCS1.6C]|uniref:glycosyltransferase family 2 protein n=1 Tax=unclassified Phyllobacterium TaxID=2638441 RepID=UPI0022651D42|nr:MULTISPECIES: glycosyl transferase family 2 [unclassified Phyllobacterium]MCX8281438.1 glycosyl transferase family 2 [Phyllobacterium sp. 0TCS1.6C]MCX8295906.1 glycosyl transferase family 2 [Phyllobacterium sp. 0TCS1.6A]